MQCYKSYLFSKGESAFKKKYPGVKIEGALERMFAQYVPVSGSVAGRLKINPPIMLDTFENGHSGPPAPDDNVIIKAIRYFRSIKPYRSITGAKFEERDNEFDPDVDQVFLDNFIKKYQEDLGFPVPK